MSKETSTASKAGSLQKAPPEEAARPPRAKTAVHHVVDQIESMIDTRVIKPGERLPVTTHLAETIGVSRSVVLQALSILEREGRVSVRRGRGGVIALPLPTSAREMRRAWLQANRIQLQEALVLREVIEPGVVRLLAERGLPKKKAWKLSALVEEMTITVEDEDEWRGLDAKFHDLLEEILGVQAVSVPSKAARSQIAAAYDVFDWKDGHRVKSSLQHAEILNALLAGNAEVSARLARDHVRATAAVLARTLRNGSRQTSQQPRATR